MGFFAWRRLAATLCFLAALPAADFTTYIGDANDYRVARVIADASGNTYVAGTRDGGMFVMKLDAAGKIALFATLSGKGMDQPNDLAVDAAGNLYLAGATNSALLPLRNALQSTPGPGFVVKFNPDATQLLYSTYFPAAIQALALDAAGNIYVTGSTYSAAFPVTPGLPAGTVTPPGSINATSAAFLTKISAAGDQILYSTRISGHQKNCGAGSSCFLSSRSTLGSCDRGGRRGQRLSRREHRHGRPAHDQRRAAGARHRRIRGQGELRWNGAGVSDLHWTGLPAGQPQHQSRKHRERHRGGCGGQCLRDGLDVRRRISRRPPAPSRRSGRAERTRSPPS